MATVRSSTENQMAMTLVPADNRSWIGLFNDGRFYWSDGSSVLFENWDNGYNPIGSMTVVCGVTSIDNSGKFNFFSCETKLPFVCYSIYSPKKQVVKMILETKDSVDLNDPVLKANILKKLQDRLEEHRVTGVTLKWKEHPGGEVFRKEKNLKKTDL
ncbi:lithostathine-like [Fundulus heteroclitus]|uniref:lithostathine-like n=1 Tax=Fundulus heteroclitus TaxID=8078 RepID=UPI00165B8619|nr:lithostathine-like [Fundulus heteroclitus]